MEHEELNKQLLGKMSGYYFNTYTVKQLLDSGADVNVKGLYGVTPLLAAAQRKDNELMKLLIERGADVNAKNNLDKTAFIISADEKNLTGMKLLVDAGSDINFECYDNYCKEHFNALGIAFRTHSYNIANYLLAKGISSGHTASLSRHLASFLMHHRGKEDQLLETFERLVDNGFDFGHENSYLPIVANALAIHDRPTCVMFMIEKGYDPTRQDNYKNSLLHTYAARNKDDMIGLLAHYFSDLNNVNADGLTPLMMAARSGQNKSVQKLIDLGADINYQNKNGSTAIMQTLGGRNVVTARLLLENGADPDLADVAGKTYRDYVEALADVNYKGSMVISNPYIVADVSSYKSQVLDMLEEFSQDDGLDLAA